MKAIKDISHLIFFLLGMIHKLIRGGIPAGICSSKNGLQIFDRQLRSNQIQFSIFCVLFFAQIFNFKPGKMFICQIHNVIEKIVLRLLKWLLGSLSKRQLFNCLVIIRKTLDCFNESRYCIVLF